MLPKNYTQNSWFCQVFMKNPGDKKIPRIFFGVFLKSKVVFGFTNLIDDMELVCLSLPLCSDHRCRHHLSNVQGPTWFDAPLWYKSSDECTVGDRGSGGLQSCGHGQMVPRNHSKWLPEQEKQTQLAAPKQRLVLLWEQNDASLLDAVLGVSRYALPLF